MKMSLALIAAAATLAAAAACAPYAEDPGPYRAGSERLDARAMRTLDTHLSGKVAGAPQDCIMSQQADRMMTVGNDTLLFRVSSDLVYRNDLAGSCPMEGSSRRLQRRSITTQLCRAEQMDVIHNQTGAYIGTCILGDFVPYRSR